MKNYLKIFLLLCILISLSNYSYSQYAWEKEVFLDIKEKPLRYALSNIRNQTNLNLIYNDDLAKKRIDKCNIRGTAEETIRYLLNKNGLSFKKFDNNTIVIFEKKPLPPEIKTARPKPTIQEDFNVQEGKLLRATLLSTFTLNYPEEAIKKNLHGEVLLKILIDANGDVSIVKLAKSSGHEILDTATINYTKRLKFLPAEYKNTPQAVWTTMHVVFNL